MRLKALLVVAAIVAGSAVSAQRALPPTRDQFFATMGAYLDILRIQAGIPGMAAAIVGDTSTEWAAAFGARDIASVDPMKNDTPFQFDGLTQLVTTAMVLQCVDQGTTTLTSPIGNYSPSSPDAAATVGQVLTQTTPTAGGLAFTYNLQRLENLKFVIETCQGLTFRQAFTKTLQRLGMMDSVPGPDAPLPELKNSDVASPADAARYRSILFRLPTPYAVSAQNTATVTSYTVKTLGAASGLISTVYDFAKFDLALKQGLLLRHDTLAAAWSNPVNADGLPLPHGMGWFVQSYNGEPVVWQYGISPAVSSSLVITLPNRNVTLILLANSDGLAKPASLVAGDVTVSPFAKIFLGLVVK
ncbi:MAG TPA: serine hydrolase domain-containing protein [Vicinamibacterales bacterium]|nr:serine hydrolase domain-containing protein [Vicinamibacterales bacterium]